MLWILEQKELVIDAASGGSQVRNVLESDIIGPVGYGLKQYVLEEKNFFSFGKGILTGTNIPGTKRLIFNAYSPLWTHFFSSTMGGAAYIFSKLGVNYVKITGKYPKTVVLEIKREKGKIDVRFHEVDVNRIWAGYSDKTGIYALQKWVHDKFSKDFNACRILVTGPASAKTRIGAIASAPIEKGQITPVDCWAGRGGIGSKLLQDHNIAAIIYGGDFEGKKDSPLRHYEKIDKIFEHEYHKKMIAEDMEATVKYRYDSALHSGGTFGVNFTRLKGWMFAFNYQSVNFSEEERVKIHNDFILNHYLKQFNEETIEKKQFKHCGEPCGAVCKKMNGIYKKDYEPYEALGPQIGVFDQRAAEKVNHYADAMGFDAIQVGGLISWIMECVQKHKFPKEEFNIDMEPKWDFHNFDIVNDSHHNADMACQIIDRILNEINCSVFRKNIRNAAKELEAKYPGVKDLAVYNAFGDEGCMVPNQYWVPGMFSPMPVMGKYFEYYGADYMSPFELGKKNVERMIKELYSDNAGICRFHRKWVENILQDIVNKLFGVEIDYYSHHKKISQRINLGNKPVFWETQRVVDIIHGYLKKVLVGEPDNEKLREWTLKFENDKWTAAKEYWQQLLDGMNSAFSD